MTTWQSKFKRYLIGESITALGSEIVQYTIIWYITLETKSGIMMTISTLAGFLPRIIISPFAGVFADRFNRKYIVIISDLIIAACTLLLAFLFIYGNESIYYIFIILAIRSLGSGIQTPASSALLPQIVPSESLLKANGISSTLRHLTALLSPVIGGFVLATIGFSFALFIDVTTAIIGSTLILLIKIPTHQVHVSQDNSMKKDISLGISYIRKDKVITSLLIFYLTFFFFVAPMVFLTPLMIARSFGDDVWRLTIFEMVFSIGSALGGVLISLWGGFKEKLKTVAFAAITFSILNTLVGFAFNFIIFSILCFFAGIMVTLFHAPATSFLQTYVKENMLGRVMSLTHMVLGSTMPLGMLVFGPLADSFTVEKIMVASGLIMLTIAIWFKNNPTFKGL